jgi:hypothetical protein
LIVRCSMHSPPRGAHRGGGSVADGEKVGQVGRWDGHWDDQGVAFVVAFRLEASQATDQIIDDAMLAERVGFDGVWLAERHARTQRATRGVQPLAGHDLRC